MSYPVAIFAIIVITFTALMAVIDLSVVFGGFLSWLGNPLLQKLGLQGGPPGSEYIGRHAKVVTCEGYNIRVELDGANWKAVSNNSVWNPEIGELVRVTAVDGLTIKISKGG